MQLNLRERKILERFLQMSYDGFALVYFPWLQSWATTESTKVYSQRARIHTYTGKSSSCLPFLVSTSYNSHSHPIPELSLFFIFISLPWQIRHSPSFSLPRHPVSCRSHSCHLKKIYSCLRILQIKCQVTEKSRNWDATKIIKNVETVGRNRSKRSKEKEREAELVGRSN